MSLHEPFGGWATLMPPVGGELDMAGSAHLGAKQGGKKNQMVPQNRL